MQDIISSASSETLCHRSSFPGPNSDDGPPSATSSHLGIPQPARPRSAHGTLPQRQSCPQALGCNGGSVLPLRIGFVMIMQESRRGLPDWCKIEGQIDILEYD